MGSAARWLIFVFCKLAFRNRLLLAKRNLLESSISTSVAEAGQIANACFKLAANSATRLILEQTPVKPTLKDIPEGLNHKGTALLLSGHFLNIEEGAEALAGLFDQPIGYVYQPAPTGFLRDWLKRHRLKAGLTPATFKELARALRVEEVSTLWSIAPDLRPSDTGQESSISFLGKPTRFHTGWIRLAQKHRLPVYYWHLDEQQQKPQIEIVLISENAADESHESILQAYVRQLESTIENNPDNWVWFHDRWQNK